MILAAGAIMARELLAEPVRDDAADPARQGETAERERDYEALAAQFGRKSEPAPTSEPEPALEVAAEAEAEADAPLPVPLLEAPKQRFELGALIERLSYAAPESGGGRRVLVTSLDGASSADDLARELGRTLARDSRAILISLDGNGDLPDHHGFTDLVAGEMSFTDTIQRETTSRLHTVGPGFLDGALSPDEWRAIDVVLTAFDQTYDWVVCILHEGKNEELFKIAATRMHTVVIASNDEPTSLTLVSFYDQAKAAGVKDVVVAREAAPAEEANSELEAA